MLNKHCDLRIVKVREIDHIETPWNMHYHVYEDLAGRFYHDADDDTDQVILSSAATVEEALADLREYIEMLSVKAYFIADDNGVLYAHDIEPRAKAQAILDDILTAHPEYEDFGLEVLEEV